MIGKRTLASIPLVESIEVNQPPSTTSTTETKNFSETTTTSAHIPLDTLSPAVHIAPIPLDIGVLVRAIDTTSTEYERIAATTQYSDVCELITHALGTAPNLVVDYFVVNSKRIRTQAHWEIMVARHTKHNADLHITRIAYKQ